MSNQVQQTSFCELAHFIWSVADILRGDYKAHQYATSIMPFVVLRRMECVLDGTRDEVRAEYLKRTDSCVNLEPFLTRKTGQSFYCVSEFTLPSLLADQRHVRQNLISYIGDFSDDARDVFEQFEFIKAIGKLDEQDLLFQVLRRFASILLINGQDPKHIVRGNTLSEDGFTGEKFDYQAANPPFGVDWKKVKDPRIFGIVPNMLAKMVWKGFQQPGARS